VLPATRALDGHPRGRGRRRDSTGRAWWCANTQQTEGQLATVPFAASARLALRKRHTKSDLPLAAGDIPSGQDGAGIAAKLRSVDSDWSRERLAQLLYEAWTEVADGHTPQVSSTMPVPGDIGLRGRFHYLDDAEQRTAVPASAFRISRDRWDEQLAAARRGDGALTGQDSAGARAAFEQLRALRVPGTCELPVVDALIGLADAARQDDAVDDAIRLCQQAIATAERIRYRFGEIRALTALGYLMLRSGSAAGSAETFQRAADQAQRIDERLYNGNALTGRGEALARLRQFDDAKAALAQAHAIFVALHSDAGIANAAQHLGDLHRRLRELDAAEAALTTAYEASERAGQVIGMVNAADALGDVHLGRGDVETAMSCYERAYAISEKHGYRRGQAHAHAGVARAAFTVEVYDVADAEFAAAADVFAELDDMTSTAIAVSGRARCAEATGPRTCRACTSSRSWVDRPVPDQWFVTSTGDGVCVSAPVRNTRAAGR
jgi:tetratricopeptide (TPR) repeat protein